MPNNLYIESFVRLTNEQLIHNNECFALNTENTLDEKVKILYKNLNLQYPKFYKMDLLSKTGIIVSEFLLRNRKDLAEISLLFANQTASLHTDVLYQAGIENKNNFIPSPSLFVYTLPNIVMGEICIKHKITGENIFLILDEFNPLVISENIILQFSSNKTSQLLFCWVEVSNQNLDVLACLITNNKYEKNTIFNKENILKIYQNGTNY